MFLSKLKAKSSMTLSTVNFVVQQTSSLVFDIVSALQRQTMSFLERIGQSETPEGQQLNQQFANAAKPFQCLDTEHKQMKYFVQTGYLVQPVVQPLPGVSYTQQRDSQTGTVKQVAVQDTFQRIPLRPLLKIILESPGTMEKIMEWKRKLSDSNSLGDTTVLKISSVFPTEPSVPLLLYNDDCEMISQAFSILFPDHAERLCQNWKLSFKDKILHFASQEKKAQELLHNVENLSPEVQSDIALRLLPMILPTPVYKNGMKMFKPSLEENIKSFIEFKNVNWDQHS
ncbi:uncharacterized protein LOC127617299 isoform X2 [Xyrauchen texanus]|uniref:uncharacterized protein LOC127617299 isoform X2 n=1 Tax=Xyrauchen texanus TaxID=154827 RepID=UPI002241C766|nr:uncharacterized protein LOC127617299 isoform X2 [Xyrauchen texanus]